ncbi:MAG TPA: bifunctional 4-hydroxy-2-oxoglutarate aldolase/2-dehydro-3-deoxy-phosphogluconate aldolase [Candidatus Hydrogenedentes bacterium]|nr:bifunctional 4-hydroxy-2-oxoglutarate aldolase/2-dehydro-3-deoxy-phosphogluconate aldolase [Candidatus Hydrogenedentota bacterium]
MEHQKAIQYVLDKGIIAIVRADSGGDDLVKVVEAVAAGGVHCIEVTMTTPGALECLRAASAALKGVDTLLGMGTVLDAETCRMAILAGANFIVTPVLAPAVIETARRYSRPVCCGAYTPTEIFTAWQHGSDFVKVFPANAGGPDYIKAIKGPLPQIPLVPTGGIELHNIADFIKAGASAVGVGGNLVSKKLMAARDFAGITANAKAFAEAMAAAKK